MKRIFIRLVLVVTMLVGLSSSGGLVYAASPTDAAKQEACTGINSQTGGTCGSGGADLTKIVKAVIYVLSVIAGVAAVIMIIISGMKYITSGGDAQAVGGAKKTLIYAIIGLVVVAFSQFIVHFVLSKT